MSAIELMNADVCPGDTHYSLATVTTHAVIAIPSEMRGKFCSFAATAGSGDAVDVAIRFGTSASLEVDITSRSSVDGSSKALTATGKEPHIVVPASGEIHRRLQGEWTHFAHESSATSGALNFGLCQGGLGAD